MHGHRNLKHKKRSYHSGYCDVAVVWAVNSTIYPDGWGNKILWNVDEHGPDYMASYPEDAIYQ